MEPIWSPSLFHVARKPHKLSRGENMCKVSKPCLSFSVIMTYTQEFSNEKGVS